MFLTERDPLHDVIDWISSADLGEDEVGVAAASTIADLPRRSSPNKFPAVGKDIGGSPASSTNLLEPSPPGFLQPSRSSSSYCGNSAESLPQVEPEQAEWDARQQQTGAAGRMVTYEDGDNPTEDLLLRGASWQRKVVASVMAGGKAYQAGVKAGDVLVSIDGKKDFQSKSADSIHGILEAPVVLVFMGFVGKLEAEVRLNYKQKVCGLSSQQQVIFGRPDAPVQVMDEVVFQPGSATLFLATRTGSGSGRNPTLSPTVLSRSSGSRAGSFAGDAGARYEEEDEEEEEDCIDIDTLTSAVTQALRQEKATADAQELSAVYELRGHEARKILSRALSRSAPRVLGAGSGTGTASGRGRLLNSVAGDLAQAPRSLDPLPSAFASRLEPKGPGESMGAKLDGGDDGFMGGDRDRRHCDIEGWFGPRCEASG